MTSDKYILGNLRVVQLADPALIQHKNFPLGVEDVDPIRKEIVLIVQIQDPLRHPLTLKHILLLDVGILELFPASVHIEGICKDGSLGIIHYMMINIFFALKR